MPMRHFEIDPSTLNHSVVPEWDTPQIRSEQGPTGDKPSDIAEVVHGELLKRLQERKK